MRCCSMAMANHFAYNFHDISHKDVFVDQDLDGLFGSAGSTASTSEPSWCYRLWPASILLSKYLERLERQTLMVSSASTVLELGAGTGLCSIVAYGIGARRVVATDIKKPLHLLHHNFKQNFNSYEIVLNSSLEAIIESSSEGPSYNPILCPQNHELTSFEVPSDEYCCNLCEMEMDELQICWNCRDCNFDMCSSCHEVALNGSWETLPLWYRLLLESTKSPSNSANGIMDNNSHSKGVTIQSLDWLNDADIAAVVTRILQGIEELKSEQRSTEALTQSSILILASDVTYSSASTAAFFHCLKKIMETLESLELQSIEGVDSNSHVITLLLAHHERTKETTQLLQDHLNESRWNYQVVHQEQLTEPPTVDFQDDDNNCEQRGGGGQVTIYRVELNGRQKIETEN